MGGIGPVYRKALAATLLVFFLFGFLFGLALPVGGLFLKKQERVAELEERVARYLNVQAREEIYKARLQELLAVPLPKIAYEGASLAVLNSQFQNDIRTLISRSGGRIENLQTLPALEEAQFSRIGIRISLRVDMKAMAEMLRLMDHHKKLMVLDNIVLRTSENQNSRRPPEIAIRGDIYGYGLAITQAGEEP